jgi:hypothetical protein
MSSPNVNLTNGQAGTKNIINTTAWTAGTGAKARYIQVITDAVIASYTDALESDAVQLTAVTLAAGTVLEGRFSALTLTSGIVRLHF